MILKLKELIEDWIWRLSWTIKKALHYIILQRCISEPHKNMYVSIAYKSDTKDLFHNNIQVRVTYYLNALQIIGKYKKQDLVAS